MEITKYKVGDRVRILPPEELIKHPDIDASGRMARNWGGKVMTVRLTNQWGRLPYKMIEDMNEGSGGWHWSDSMIAGLEKEIEVSKADLMAFLIP